MLWYYRETLCWCTPLLAALLLGAAWVAYRANARRDKDDPDRKEFEFSAIWLVPLTWPLLLPLVLLITAIRAIVEITLVGLFAIGVLAIRKPFIISWLEKIALKIGNKLMEANSLLIRAILGKPLRLPK